MTPEEVENHFGVELSDEEMRQVQARMTPQEVEEHFADAQVVEGVPGVSARSAQMAALGQSDPPVTPGTAQELERMQIVSPEMAQALAAGRQPQPMRATPKTPRPSTGGAMGALNRLGGDAEDVQIASAERIKEVEEAKKQAVESAANVGLMKLDAQRAVADKALQNQAEHAQRMDQLAQAEENALQEMRAADAYTSDLAQTHMTPEEYAQHRAIIDDPTSSQEDVERAKKAIESKRGIDKDRIWGGNTFGKVMAHIALALFGGKLPGLSQVINSAISRDIAEQKAQMDANARNDKETENFFAQSFQRFGDVRAAHHKSFVAKADSITAELDKMMLDVQDPAIAAQLQEQKAKIQEQAADARNKLDMRMQELAQQRGMQEVAVRQQLGAQRHQQAMQTQRMQAEAQKAMDSGTRLPFGLSGEPVSKKALNDTVGAMSAASGILSTLSRLDQHVAEEGFTQYLTEEDAIGGSMATQLQMEMKDLLELGVLTGPDMEILENIIPSDPGQIRQGKVKAKLKQARTYIVDKLRARVRSAGLDLDTDAFSSQHATGDQRARAKTRADAASLGAVAY